MSTAESSTKWVDVQNDGSLDGFARTNNLDPNSLRSLKEGVVILPMNTFFERESSFNLFPKPSKDILLSLREKGLQTTLYEDGREKRNLILKSEDIVLPILLFVGQAALQLGLSILANLISDRLLRRKEKPPAESRVRVQYAQIDQKSTIVRWRRIDGPSKDVARMLMEEAQVLAGQGLTKNARTQSSRKQRKVR